MLTVHRLAFALLCASLLAPALAVADPGSGAVAELSAARTRSFQATLQVDRTVRLGPSYQVDSLTVSVGDRVLARDAELQVSPMGRVAELETVTADLRPGETVVKVDAVVRGKGTGEFAWLSRYSLQVSGRCDIELFRGSTTHVDVLLVRRAGPFADFDEGIEVECRAAVQPR
jgi:hypothetical protein